FYVSIPVKLNVRIMIDLIFLIVRSSHCLFLFFFSSRRRHTRFKCDWSSDVCSSDLPVEPHPAQLFGRLRPRVQRPGQRAPTSARSEERRVGKECISQGWSYI